MRISKNEWFVGFGLWAGAWAFISLISGLFFELQMINWPNDSGSLPFSFSNVPVLEPALVFLIAANAVKNRKLELLLIFSFFGSTHLYLGHLYWILSYLLCGGADCSFILSILENGGFDWGALAFEVSGYCVAAVFLFVWPKVDAARLLKWLEFDAVGYRQYWHKWLNLPLWSYAKAIKYRLLKLVPAFCCIAAVWSAILIFGQVLAPFWNSVIMEASGEEEPYDLLVIMFTASPLMLIYCWIAFIGGRLMNDFGYHFSLSIVLLGTVLVNLLEIISTGSIFVQLSFLGNEAIVVANSQLWDFGGTVLGWFFIALVIVLGNRTANRAMG